MNSFVEIIANYYNNQSENEWERLERHRTEYAVTLRALSTYLPPPPARILDCGGGPGKYSTEMARQGYQVTLFDLSSGNLQLAEKKAKEAGVAMEGYEQGNALDLSRFQENSFDIVLLMGPLYHLLELDERVRALSEAHRVLNPGGKLAAAFISRYAAHRDIARRNPRLLLEMAEFAEQVEQSGRLLPRNVGNDDFVAYLAHPAEVAPLCWQVGLEVDSILGVEGIVSMQEEQVNELSGLHWEKWVDLNYRLAPDPSIHGCVEHLLVLASKPRWRSVLSQIGRRLSEAELEFKIVGGASLALQGVQTKVKDLDIEVDAETAYRFQDLFSTYVVQPVSWSESKIYRSHFGRFDFNGVQVEVMGDLQRVEADTWVPSWSQTRSIVEVDGVSVPVSWLEEETLAYLRRERLERAALCLKYCDPDRLLRLLLGQEKTNVI